MNILVQPYTHTLSHISRPLSVAKELRNRGHNVIFSGESPKTKLIKQEGFTVHPFYEPDPELLFGNIRKGRLKFVSDTEIERMIEADIALFREVKPHLVLSDGRFTAPISTHIADIKHVAIVNVSSTAYRAIPYIPLFEWMPNRLLNRKSKVWKLLDTVNLELEMFIFDNAMNIFKKLSKKYGIKETITATNCLTGKDITLLADIPEYFATRSLPRNYYYIGPITLKSNLPLPSWWPLKKEDKPLIYVTMGTTGVSDFFYKVYDFFKSSDITAIITTGEQAKNLETIDGKIYVEDFIDGDLAMEQCDLVVCHGGNGTIYQALQHGKPLIGIPTILDQKFNMRRVETIGVGKMLSWYEFSRNPASLLQLVSTIIKEKSFFKNAAKFKETLKTYNASKAAADIIEKEG